MRSLVLVLALALYAPLLTVGAVAPAYAQVNDRPNISREFYDERRRQAGDSVTFCINPGGFMSGYEEEVGKTIADALLLEAKFSYHTTRQITPPLDYRLLFNPSQIFVFLQENCDGFMGFTLAAEGYPSWMSITRPYLSSRMIMVVKDPAVKSLADLPLDKQIAVRSLSQADNQMLIYLQSLPKEQRWERRPLFDNQRVLEALANDDVGAALIWEPAVLAFTHNDLAAAGLHEVPLPFAVLPLDFGIAMRSVDSYLRTNIDQAIDALRRDGTLDDLTRRMLLE